MDQNIIILVLILIAILVSSMLLIYLWIILEKLEDYKTILEKH